ncbi:energy-coupling factor transporter transmembrane component T [Solirubrobacter soli]|uniref:energy-coupling factor transporter transmembrane component T n=1 Tax=Solirubrobacter soli TaxID=363832 RepID=UPI000A017D05|nr:energy-coupling factor transporter transmembrane component T [Solirubrobacter soli]
MRRSPLHATRAGVGGAWCLALGAVAGLCEHPAVLVAVLAVVVVVGVAAGLGPQLRQTARWGVPFALVVLAVNVLLTRDGATVIFRGPHLPVFGQVDFTLEATAYGAVLGLRMLVIFATAVLLTAAIDNDELLRALRRVSVRSGVTAALAMRLFGVLKRDAARMADAQRCLPGGGVSRMQVLHAVTAGALDRATDVAATLEVRGFGSGGRPPRMPRPWSRHDFAFGASTVVLFAIAAGGALGLWAPFDPYPRLQAPLTAATLVIIAVLAVAALLPFADRRGIG